MTLTWISLPLGFLIEPTWKQTSPHQGHVIPHQNKAPFLRQVKIWWSQVFFQSLLDVVMGPECSTLRKNMIPPKRNNISQLLAPHLGNNHLGTTPWGQLYFAHMKSNGQNWIYSLLLCASMCTNWLHSLLGHGFFVSIQWDKSVALDASWTGLQL